jgi:hypothetical protein
MANKHNADRIIIRECPEGTEFYTEQSLTNLHAYAHTLGVKLKGTVSYVIDKASGVSSKLWKVEIVQRPTVTKEDLNETTV